MQGRAIFEEGRGEVTTCTTARTQSVSINSFRSQNGPRETKRLFQGRELIGPHDNNNNTYRITNTEEAASSRGKKGSTLGTCRQLGRSFLQPQKSMLSETFCGGP